LRLFDLPGLYRWQSTTRNIALDRAELANRVERDALRTLAIQVLGEEFAELVANALYPEAALGRRAHLRRAIRRHCAAYRTYNAVESRARSLARGISWVARSLNKKLPHAPRMSNRCAPAGGLLVAFVGVDGSGKSTALGSIKNWLGPKFDVIPMYFGTGEGRASLWLRPFKLILPIIVRILRRHQHRGGRSPNGFQGHAASLPYQAMLMGWAIAVALDKRKKLKVARRALNRGFIVLADRYPQSQTAGFNDGPMLTSLPAVPDWLRRFEAGVYRIARQLPPNLVIKLVAREDTIARREPEMDPALVQDRIAALRHLQFPGARVVCVDAEKPLAEVIGLIKQEIWRSI
jgi:thymidylate kinase